jgi:hypothetical protein
LPCAKLAPLASKVTATADKVTNFDFMIRVLSRLC